MRDTSFSSADAASRPHPRYRYPLAALACGLTTLVTQPLHDWLEPVNAVMLFLLTVVLIATRLGRGPAVLASFLSVGLFDFFYVPPRWSFAVSDVQYLLTFAVMLTVALIIAHLAIGLRTRAEEADRAAQRAKALYDLASRLAGAMSVDQVLGQTRDFTTDLFQADLTLLLPAPDRKLTDAAPQARPLPSTVLLVADTVAREPVRTGAHHIREDDVDHLLLHLAGSTRNRGVLVVSATGSAGHGLQTHKALLEAVASLVSTALERLHFVEVAYQTELEINDARLRNSILSALSHDIRTPLTSLFGLADTLTLMQPPLPELAQDMATAIRDQAHSLHRMVSNLLDMARLQSGQAQGALPLRREWQPIEEVIGASIQLLGHSLAHHPVKVNMPPDLPLVWIDAVLMERVFGNLLENASKYAPVDTDIQVNVRACPPLMEISVCNQGDGFPPDRLRQVFEVFERGLTESAIPGMGLGLAICKVIVEAHGGHIEALNPESGGAQVRFTLPMGTPPAIEPEALSEVAP